MLLILRLLLFFISCWKGAKSCFLWPDNKYVKNLYDKKIYLLYYRNILFSPFSHFSDYAALLSRHSSLSPTTSTAIATGRFYFRKKALSYSFVTSPDFGFPTFLTFLDEQSNIIEEFPLRQTHFQVII